MKKYELKKTEFLRYWGVTILAWIIRLRLIADLIIGILAIVNGKRLEGINLIILATVILVATHTKLFED